MVRPVGVEPTAFWSVAKRSIQLSYGRISLDTMIVYNKCDKNSIFFHQNYKKRLSNMKKCYIIN